MPCHRSVLHLLDTIYSITLTQHSQAPAAVQPAATPPVAPPINKTVQVNKNRLAIPAQPSTASNDNAPPLRRAVPMDNSAVQKLLRPAISAPSNNAGTL